MASGFTSATAFLATRSRSRHTDSRAEAVGERWCIGSHGGYLDRVTPPWVGWRLENAGGDSIVVQFAVGDVPGDVLMPGDVVDLSLGGPNAPGVDNRGSLAIVRDGFPVVFLAYGNAPPAFGADFTVTEGAFECGLGEGCGLTAAAVTLNGMSDVIPTDGSAELDGVVLRNDFYSAKDGCSRFGINDAFTLYVLGGYAAR